MERRRDRKRYTFSLYICLEDLGRKAGNTRYMVSFLNLFFCRLNELGREGKEDMKRRGETLLFIYLFVVGKEFGREEKHDLHLSLIFFFAS